MLELMSHLPKMHPLSLELERSRRATRSLEIIVKYANGDPVEDIAREYDCTRHTVLRLARHAGLPKRPKHFPEEVRAAVLKDYDDGLPYAVIVKKHKVSMAYIVKVAEETARPKRYKMSKKK